MTETIEARHGCLGRETEKKNSVMKGREVNRSHVSTLGLETGKRQPVSQFGHDVKVLCPGWASMGPLEQEKV